MFLFVFPPFSFISHQKVVKIFHVVDEFFDIPFRGVKKCQGGGGGAGGFLGGLI
jgi:hypothetical protein